MRKSFWLSSTANADTSSELTALRHLQDMRQLEPRVVDKILWDNARALYGL